LSPPTNIFGLLKRNVLPGQFLIDFVDEAARPGERTLYGHFSTKEELALLAFDYAWKDTSDKRLRNVETVSNAVDKLRLHIDNYVNTPSFPGVPSSKLCGRCR